MTTCENERKIIAEGVVACVWVCDDGRELIVPDDARRIIGKKIWDSHWARYEAVGVKEVWTNDGMANLYTLDSVLQWREKLAQEMIKNITAKKIVEIEEIAVQTPTKIVKKIRRVPLDAPVVTEVQEVERRMPTFKEICEKHNIGSGVYLIEGGGLYKIGIGSSIMHRFWSLQAQCPVKLTLIAYKSFQTNAFYHDYKKEEQSLHRRYAHCRRHGEWFALNQNEVDELISLLGNRYDQD
jgi:hypothetical protein